MTTQVTSVSTFLDMQNEYLTRAKIATSTTTANQHSLGLCKRFLNERYRKVAMHKKWDWRAVVRVLQLRAKYTTGTASVTNGQRRVTLSAAATVDETFKDRKFYVSGDTRTYQVISVSSTSNRTLELDVPYQGTTNATATYALYSNRYGLWPDFADDYQCFVPGTPEPLDNWTPSEMDAEVRKGLSFEGSAPDAYTIVAGLEYYGPVMGNNFIMGYDFMGKPVTQALEIFPWPQADTTLEVRYGQQIEDMVNDEDTPLMPEEKRFVLVAGALADFYETERNLQMMSYWNKKYEDLLAAMTTDQLRVAEAPQADIVTFYRRGSGNRHRFPVSYKIS